jgi:hypothetical protein
MPRSTVILLATSIAVLLGAAGAARADVVYEWTDAHGQVHYTDQWVPGAKIVKTTDANKVAVDSNSAPTLRNQSSAAASQIKQQQEAQGEQQDEAKVRAARCTADKQQYQTLLQSRRIYTTDKSGQRTYLSDADADAARLRARQAMDADCGTGG